jgi:hypothetical protein
LKEDVRQEMRAANTLFTKIKIAQAAISEKDSLHPSPKDEENKYNDMTCRSTDQDFRNRLYSDRIEYAFYKLAENIIHTFKFYYTDSNSIEDLKHEVVTFLLEKLHLYKQEKGAAYSYFGTIAKRYLIIYNNKNYQKLQEKVDISEINSEENMDSKHIIHIERLSQDEVDLDRFVTLYVNYVTKNIYKLFPKKGDAQVADAVLELFRKRETLSILENKKALYIYIREIVDVETPHITKIVKRLKAIYGNLFSYYYEHSCLPPTL